MIEVARELTENEQARWFDDGGGQDLEDRDSG